MTSRLAGVIFERRALRLAVSSLLPFVHYVWNVVTEVAGHK
jgi:hypothetical protein